MFVHVLEPDGCITSCCCCCRGCCCCWVMSATADAKFQLLLLLLFLSLCIPFACTFSTCDSRLGWWWCCCCCCCCCGWLTDWLTAGYPLLPSSHTKSSGNYYKHTILFYQLNAVPVPAPFASFAASPFVYLVFVSFLHAHKIKCNNSKRCNNSVRYLSRFLFYFSLCLSLSVVFSFAYLIFLLFYSQPAHSLCIYISGLQHAR